MKRNGFTLIELLAVIVILAIIALIATPIILGIINDARENSNQRSVELFASSVKNGVSAYQLREMKEVAPGTYTKETLPFELEKVVDGNVDCKTIELYEDGGVYLSGCTINGSKKIYEYGTEQEILVNLLDVCDPVTTATTGNVPNGAYSIGDEYSCNVDGKNSYTFFVLSKEGNKVNLIMDANVREGGVPVKEATPTTDQKGIVIWLDNDDYESAGGKITDEMLNDGGPCQYEGLCASSAYGPITAMKYLKESTSTWTKVGKLIVSTFNDETGTEHDMKQTISSAARMPSKTEVNEVGCGNSSFGSCPLWMANYLEWLDDTTYLNKSNVSGVFGYWTDSFNTRYPSNAFYISYIGSLEHFGANLGVRPVITLSI